MSRKKNNKPRRAPVACWYSDTYWQSEHYTARLYNALRNQVMQMALTRFKWVNLPETCNERYLERTLLFNGVATIAFPRSQPGVFYSTKMVQTGRLNIYDTPTKWASIGNNGWRFNASPYNGVVVYDNMMRVPILDTIDLHVRELVDLYRARQINRMHTKTPYLITVPQDMELAATNTIKQILGGEPAILATDAFRDVSIQAIQTGVPFLGMELTAEEMNCWNRIYTCLGISNLTFKAERQIEDEVKAFKEPTDLLALSPLNARREAVDRLNDRFGLDIHVVWRQDNESENYNVTHNVAASAAVRNGDDTSDYR